MGQYRIVIEGTGCHHNARPEVVDSNDEALALVEKLQANGHSVKAARFELVTFDGTTVATDNLLTGATYGTGVYTPPPAAKEG